MKRKRPLSVQAQRVVGILAEDPRQWRHGYELCQQTGIQAGSMYPILMRLADRGWLETAWEEEFPSGRPPRHLYRLTETGLAEALASADAGNSRERPHLARLTPRAGESS